MAYVTIPKDLNNVKTKFIGNFTKRQCICFGIGIILALPVFFGVKKVADTTAAFYALIVCLVPFFLMGMMEKNGMPLEKYLKYFLLHKLRNPIRRMKMENIYDGYAHQYELTKKGEKNGNGKSNNSTSNSKKAI